MGCRHYEVARLLKEIPKGDLFTLRLVEPKTSGFCKWCSRGLCEEEFSFVHSTKPVSPSVANIASKKSGSSGNRPISSGKHTLRFKANEPARIEEVNDVKTAAEEKINALLENFLGINDADLGE